MLNEDLAPALDGIEEWSHIYVIFWVDRVVHTAGPQLHHQGDNLGIFAARSPVHPNPIGLTLVELVKRAGNALWVRLDAYDGTPVVDIKPYPDSEQGHLRVVTDFEIPGWLARIIERPGRVDQAGALPFAQADPAITRLCEVGRACFPGFDQVSGACAIRRLSAIRLGTPSEKVPAFLRYAIYFSFLQGAVILSHTARTPARTEIWVGSSSRLLIRPPCNCPG